VLVLVVVVLQGSGWSTAAWQGAGLSSCCGARSRSGWHHHLPLRLRCQGQVEVPNSVFEEHAGSKEVGAWGGGGEEQGSAGHSPLLFPPAGCTSTWLSVSSTCLPAYVTASRGCHPNKGESHEGL